jgi:hypothetical protein
VKSSGPSFLPTLIALATGLYLGRSVFPQLDPSSLASGETRRLQAEFDQRTAQQHASLLGAKQVADSLATQGAPQWAELKANLGKSGVDSEVAGAWHLLTEFARESGESVAPAADILAMQRNSPWFALGAPDPTAAAGGPSVRKAQDPSLHTLRGTLAKAESPTDVADAAAALGMAQGKVDPVAGIQWLKTLEDATRIPAVFGMAEGWATLEPREAVAWAVTLIKGEEREAAARGLARGGGHSDALTVLPWALDIVDAKQRTIAISGLLKPAAQQNAKLAKELLESASQLSEKEKADFLETLGSAASGVAAE